MTDINFSGEITPNANENARGAHVDDAQVHEIIELLFFAYRDFTGDPDAILSGDGFGRAHHRVIHFVARNPGLRVADLLGILKITKQSLARVLRQLVDQGYIDQRAGNRDRRERRLYATQRGAELAAALSTPQMARIRAALDATSPETFDSIRRFLLGMVNPEERTAVRALTEPAHGSRNNDDSATGN